MKIQAVSERSLSACTNVQKSYLFVSELKFRNRVFHLRYQLSMTEAVEYFTLVYRVITSRLRKNFRFLLDHASSFLPGSVCY